MADEQTCRWCTRPATFLCDFAIGAGTCDAPICTEHRTCVMAGMMDCSHKSGRRGGPGTGPFSIDHCPEHAAKETK
jgi:hypothetical protein